MDKYEYKLKLDEMKSLVGQGDYEKAEEIADTINWRKVKNVNSLVLASEIYSHMQRYEDSRDVLLMAYDRSPIGRTIIYRLAELAIHTHNFDEAKDYYEEFVEIAPHDNLKYVLRYELSRDQGEPITEQIAILEELKEQEYTEKWAFELAELYHRAGMSDQCIDACDDLVWRWHLCGKSTGIKNAVSAAHSAAGGKVPQFHKRKDRAGRRHGGTSG